MALALTAPVALIATGAGTDTLALRLGVRLSMRLPLALAVPVALAVADTTSSNAVVSGHWLVSLATCMMMMRYYTGTPTHTLAQSLPVPLARTQVIKENELNCQCLDRLRLLLHVVLVIKLKTC